MMVTARDAFHDMNNELFLRCMLPRIWNNLLFGIRSCHLSSEDETAALWGLRVVLAFCNRWHDGRKVCCYWWSFKLLLILSFIGIGYVMERFLVSSDGI